MRVLAVDVPPQQLGVDAVAVPIAGGQPLSGAALELDRVTGGAISEVLGTGEHRGRPNEVLPLPTGDRISARRLLLYGVGSQADLDGQRLRYAHHEMVRAARNYGYRRLGLVCGSPLSGGDLGAVIEGCVMGAWERRSRQTGSRTTILDELQVAGFGTGREGEVAAALQMGEATNRVREWQNAPANEMTPEALAGIGREIAGRHGLNLEVLGPEELRAGGYRLLLGVAAGSAQAPRLLRLEHRGAGGTGPRLALIGKGITFDSGGLSLKPAAGMETMKADMAGAAVVLSALDVIAARRLPLDVMAVVAATENMTGPAAQRPGDVVVGAGGKSVEITNTDAEGRLVLADAITLALRRGATHLLDLATLTGAAGTALGHAGTLAVSNDDDLWRVTARAAELAGDRAWRLPLYPEYRGLLRSRIADLRNAGYGEAGAICAGMFLEQFVENRPWVHLDIAASSWNDNDDLTSIPRGPLGSGARLAVKLAELLAGSER